mmetsp:Transcript_29344/g.62420  ORF Transcript_29344/g.62420 Transcript_29344/m.62420 type:complete len:233 (+) Transcript_29344:568-1266(+)
MPADLPKGPRSGCLQVILGFVDQCVLEGGDSFGYHHRQSQGLGESGDVAKTHDAWQAVVATGLYNVPHHGIHSASIHDQLREIRRVPGDLPDEGCRVLPNKLVGIFEAIQYAWEDIGLHHDLGKVYRVLGDLRQARADLPLQGHVPAGELRGKKRDRTSIHYDLGKIRGVLANVGQRRCGDSLQWEVRLLETENKERHSTCVNDGLGEILGVPRDVSQGPRCCLLHRGVELI